MNVYFLIGLPRPSPQEKWFDVRCCYFRDRRLSKKGEECDMRRKMPPI